jgi:hypothetical protein
MNAFHAWRDGIRRVNRAPMLLAGAWLVTALVALPSVLDSFAPGTTISAANLSTAGASAPARTRWAVVTAAGEFMVRAAGPALALGRELSAVLALPVEAVVRELNWMQPLGASTTSLLLWMFMAGGVIDRYARDRATGAFGFFGASGVFFFRFLRLAILLCAVCVLAYSLASDRPVVMAGVLAFVVLVTDFAQVRMVVEDRRSVLGAIAASLAFLRRNWIAAVSVYVFNYAILAAVAGLYPFVTTDFGMPAGGGVAIASQLYIIALLWVRLVFWATETSLFQSRLAHAGYVARPEPRWPDSPSAEALRRL